MKDDIAFVVSTGVIVFFVFQVAGIPIVLLPVLLLVTFLAMVLFMALVWLVTLPRRTWALVTQRRSVTPESGR